MIYKPPVGSLLTTYEGNAAALWKIVDYLSGDRVTVKLVNGSPEFMRRVNKYGRIKPDFRIHVSSLSLEPPNEMLVLALAASE